MDLNRKLIPSPDVVAREMEGEFIIIPIVAGIVKGDDELFTLNEIGLDIWKKLDPGKSLKDVLDELVHEYETDADEIEKDLIGFVTELHSRKLLIDA